MHVIQTSDFTLQKFENWCTHAHMGMKLDRSYHNNVLLPFYHCPTAFQRKQVSQRTLKMPVSSIVWNSTNGFRTAYMQRSVRNRVFFAPIHNENASTDCRDCFIFNLMLIQFRVCRLKCAGQRYWAAGDRVGDSATAASSLVGYS
jgi:hypothetical protein